MKLRFARSVLLILITAMLAFSPASVQTTRAATPKIYIVNTFGGTIVTADLNGSNGTAILGSIGTAIGIALDETHNKMYLTDCGNHRVLVANMDGTGLVSLGNLGGYLNCPVGIAVDVAGNKMYIANENNSNVVRANLDGSNVENFGNLGGNISAGEGIALDLSARKLYVVSYLTSSIVQANLDGTGIVNLGNPGGTLGGPYGIAIDSTAGKMYITNFGSDTVAKANLDGSGASNLGNIGGFLNGPAGIAVDPVNQKIYISNNGRNIVTANLDGSGAVNLGNPNNLLNGPRLIALSGVAYPVLHLSSSSLNFGNQGLGTTSAAQTVTVTNTGTADLHIGLITFTSDWIISNDTCSSATIAPSGNCTFDVSFHPLALGPLTGNITINSDAYSGPNSISLSGNGVEIILATFTSLGTYDGQIIEKNETYGDGATANTSGGFLGIGDTNFDQQILSLLHFDTSSLPDGAVVTSATLFIRQYQIVGTNPFSTHGTLWVDFGSPFFGTNATLQPTDFAAASGLSLSTNPLSGTWYEMLLTDGSAVNPLGSTQLRLRFNLDDNDNHSNDIFRFFSGNAVAAYRPMLYVQYYVP